MTKKISIFKIFPLILAGGLVIGIISNIIYPKNIKLSCLVVIACSVLAFVWPIFRNFTNQISKNLMTHLLIGGLGLILIVQLLILNYLPVTIIHDSFRTLSQAELLSRNNYNWGVSTYFWRYPNNVSLAFLLGQWLKFTNLFGMTTNFAIHILSLIFLDSFIGVSLFTIRRISKKNSLVMTILLFFLISPFAYTYYLRVFYSDLPILLCLLLTFNILLKWPILSKKGKVGYGISLFMLILIGQLVKPNLIVFAVAVIILLAVLFIRDRKQFIRYLLPFTIILASFAASFPTQKGIEQTTHFTHNPKYELPSTSWIWMSYSPKSRGTYAGSAVTKMESLSTLSARKKYLQTALPKRIKNLGIRKVFERWFIKVGILLNVGNVQKSYTGGLIESPNVSPKVQILWHMLGSLIMRVSFIFLYALALFKCLVMLIKPVSTKQPVIDLAVVLCVGYLMFHALIWEAESRYGQSLLPLLFLINAVPTPDTSKVTKSLATWKRGLITGGTAGVAVVIFLTETLSLVRPQKVVMATQRSQMSMQYKAKLTTLKTNEVVSQNVKINQPVTKVSVDVLKGTHLSGSLISLSTHKSYPLKRSTTYLMAHGKFARGTYELKLKNKYPKAQKIQIVRTQRYKLAPYSLRMNGQKQNYSSLLYTFSTKVKS